MKKKKKDIIAMEFRRRVDFLICGVRYDMFLRATEMFRNKRGMYSIGENWNLSLIMLGNIEGACANIMENTKPRVILCTPSPHKFIPKKEIRRDPMSNQKYAESTDIAENLTIPFIFMVFLAISFLMNQTVIAAIDPKLIWIPEIKSFREIIRPVTDMMDARDKKSIPFLPNPIIFISSALSESI